MPNRYLLENRVTNWTGSDVKKREVLKVRVACNTDTRRVEELLMKVIRDHSKALKVPGTPTPRVTNTIDPTLAARFIVTLEPTRLATFTQPPPLVIPTFVGATAGTDNGTVPMGLIVIVLFILGLTIGLFALAQRR